MRNRLLAIYLHHHDEIPGDEPKSFAELRSEFAGLRSLFAELKARFADLRWSFADLRSK